MMKPWNIPRLIWWTASGACGSAATAMEVWDTPRGFVKRVCRSASARYNAHAGHELDAVV